MTLDTTLLDHCLAETLRTPPRPVRYGKVRSATGLVIEATGLGAAIGEMCTLRHEDGGSAPVQAEVIGVRGSAALLMPLGEATGLRAGSLVERAPRPHAVGVGDALLGPRHRRPGPAHRRQGAPRAERVAARPRRAARARSTRQLIDAPLRTGVRAIDAMLTLAKGQRVGIFAGSGVGKSTLLGRDRDARRGRRQRHRAHRRARARGPRVRRRHARRGRARALGRRRGHRRPGRAEPRPGRARGDGHRRTFPRRRKRRPPDDGLGHARRAGAARNRPRRRRAADDARLHAERLRPAAAPARARRAGRDRHDHRPLHRPRRRRRHERAHRRRRPRHPRRPHRPHARRSRMRGISPPSTSPRASAASCPA